MSAFAGTPLIEIVPVAKPVDELPVLLMPMPPTA